MTTVSANFSFFVVVKDLVTEIAAIFAICDCDAHRRPWKRASDSERRQSSAILRFKVPMKNR